MKKYRFLSLAMVLAVMLMGAGYAYWTETLTINSTVSTGELDVVFDKMCIDHGDYDDSFPIFRDYMDVNVTPSPDGKSLQCEFKNIYPGAGGFIGFKIVNNGTVPAKLSSLEAINISDEANLKDIFKYRIDNLRIYKPSILGFEWIIPVGHPLEANSFDYFVSILETKLSKYQLEPFGYLVINGEGSGYNIEMPREITSDEYEEQEFKFDLKMTFTQGQ